MPNDVRTPLALSILALLRIQPMHPYEMQRLMREWAMDEIVRLRGGSLYSTINRLLAAGLIEVIGTSREGRRPERSTYRITATGRDHLADWMRDSIVEPTEEYPRFGSAIAFAPLLTAAELRDLLVERVARLEPLVAAERERSDAWQRSRPVGRAFKLGHEYARTMRQTELHWVRSVIDDLDTGRFAWPEELLAWQAYDPGRQGDVRLPRSVFGELDSGDDATDDRLTDDELRDADGSGLLPDGR